MGKFQDIAGKTFGKLTIISLHGKDKYGKPTWNATCSCGHPLCKKTVVVVGSDIKKGNTKSCGCWRSNPGGNYKINYTEKIGTKLGRLLIVSYKGRNERGQMLFLCKCDCGKEKRIRASGLFKKQKPTRSCGCLKIEESKRRQIGSHLSQETKDKMRQSHMGIHAKEKHPNWVKDRDDVKARKKLTYHMHKCIHRCMLIKSDKKYDLLGYNAFDLKKHLESKFKPGMSWDNYGFYGWHIDHIKPIDQFLKEGITDPAIINSLSNLQPLWAQDNLSKYNKYTQHGDIVDNFAVI